MFAGFLRVCDHCPVCDAPLGEVQADDAPPYFTTVIVAHVVIALLVLVEEVWAPPLWVYATTFLPFTVLLTLGLMRPVKGATVGLMLRLGLFRGDAVFTRPMGFGAPPGLVSRTRRRDPALDVTMSRARVGGLDA